MRILSMTAALVGSVLWAGQASAHAFLKTASPAVGSTLRTAPTQVSIDFTEGVEPAFSSIGVTDVRGASVVSGVVHATGDSRLAVGLKQLAPGTYHVMWHATATDTHKTEGTFSFTLRP